MKDSKNGFMTKVWGPSMWLAMHMITLNFNESKTCKRKTKMFFKSLTGVLPCKKCRENYTKIISTGPLKLDDKVLKNRKTLSMWLFKVHNKVQQDIFEKTGMLKNKPVYKDTKKDYRVAMGFYEKFRANCNSKDYGCVKSNKGKSLKAEIKIKVNCS